MQNPFLGRLMEEEYIATSSKLRMVFDAQPLLPEHYLVFATEEAESFADMDSEGLAKFLSNTIPERLRDDYILIERGRSKSCTGGGLTHAHGHLIPARYKKVISERLSERFGGCKSHHNLLDALSSVPDTIPYLLGAQLGNDEAVELTTNRAGFGRHAIRTILSDL